MKNDKMKIHLLASPHAPTDLKDPSNAFTVIIWKYIHWLKDKYSFIHYGLPGSEVECAHYDMPKMDEGFNREAARQIMKNRADDDLIVCTYGTDNKPATELHDDLKIIEPLIGYKTNAVFAPYRVFPSYAQMHFYYGEHNMLMSPSWFDEVIPNPISPEDFDFITEKNDYVLYMGRVIHEKGIDVAVQATERAGKKLIIAGAPRSLKELGYKKTPRHVELVGSCNAEQRRKLLSEAMCLIAPTYYVEPFGNMVPEAHFSGTPTITTDWGAFPETNVQGVTGFRCRMMKDFVDALDGITDINPQDCYNHAMKTCSDKVVFERHADYLERVITDDFYAK